MARIKNEGTSTLSFESVVNKFLSPRFSSGNVDTFEIQVASKLMNGNLTTIKPMVQVRTDSFLDREIGSPKEWKRINAHHLTMKAMRYISGRVVFGEALADNAAFIKALEQYVSNAVPYALALRYFNLGPLRDTIMNLLHWRHRKDLAIATQFVTDLIIERRRIQRDQNLSDDELPVDCIQWAMDQDMPEDMKQPEKIAHRILHLCAGIIDTPGSGMINLLYDVASHGECLDELRAEIRQCLAEDGGGWTQNAMAKMKKFDSFIQECFRISPGVTPLTGWRVVTSDTFRFDEDLVLPKGVLLTFPSIHLQNDPDIHPDPTKFDPLRFYRMKEEDRKAGVTSSSRDLRTEWLAFGYGRQACPGRFYAIRLLTTVLGEMILRYDIRYAGGRRARPEPIDLEPLLGPDQSIEIEFRARA
ncbi:cytochrome P450 [Aspergillus aurantiobrunneus]